MEMKYYDIGGIHTKILRFGESSTGEEITLIIPGNPGIAQFYKDFGEELSSILGMPVYVISHAGHELPPENALLPNLKGNGFLYDLNGQIEHKRSYIYQYLPEDVKINLIGHSIGCKIILELLKYDEVCSRVKKSIMLFPTIERLAETPNGKFFVAINRYFRFLIISLMPLLRHIPNVIKVPLIKLYFKFANIPLRFVDTISELVNPDIVEKILFMAEDEMVNVKTLDVDLIMKNIENIYFYYGSNDKWCPKNFYVDLKSQIPEAKALLCQKGYRHAFVLSNSSELCHIVADWIRSS